MKRPRLYDCRSSGLPQAIGLCATDFASIAATVNEAQERLLNDPLTPDEGWWGGYVQMAFTVTQANPYIYTPREVSRIIQLNICKEPVRIRNQFYEYLQFGEGSKPSGCCTSSCGQTLGVYERGQVVTFTPLLSTPQYIRAYAADPNDVGRTVMVQGKDANDQVVRRLDAVAGQSGEGEIVTLASPFSDTSNIFSTITGIQKQKTFGEVQFFQVDPTTMVETALVVMQPGEEEAYYRSYYVNGLPSNCCTGSLSVQVLAMCKLDFIPAMVDTDYLRIMSIPALIDECQSIRYGRMDTASAQQLSIAKHMSALRLLNGQLDNYFGKTTTAISMLIFGSARMRRQPI